MKKLLLVLCVVGCERVEAESPADVVEKLQAVCGLSTVVEGVPKQVTEACAVIQRVRIAEAE